MVFPARHPRTLNPGRIRLRIDELAREAGLFNQYGTTNATSIMKGTELPSLTVNRLLRHPDEIVRLDLDTMARLCHYFDCTPGDLFAYEPPPSALSAKRVG